MVIFTIQGHLEGKNQDGCHRRQLELLIFDRKALGSCNISYLTNLNTLNSVEWLFLRFKVI